MDSTGRSLISFGSSWGTGAISRARERACIFSTDLVDAATLAIRLSQQSFETRFRFHRSIDSWLTRRFRGCFAI